LIIEVDSNGKPNTPANDHWELTFATTPVDAITPNFTYITFLPDGSIDTTRTSQSDINRTNSVLAPALSALEKTTSTTFDFWKLINWVFVSFYWTVLADLGQIAPTIEGAPQTFTANNNIFVNDTLFHIYTLYLQNTVLPLLNASASVFPPFNNLTPENSLKPVDSTFIRSYNCVERHLKSALSVIISLIVADYALIGVPYAMAISLAVAIEKRRRTDCECSQRRVLITGNYCDGCASKTKYESEGTAESLPLQALVDKTHGESG
jgi:hypothetical protein